MKFLKDQPTPVSIFINDIASATITILRLYADDTCLILNDNSPKRLEHNINNKLTKISLWVN